MNTRTIKRKRRSKISDENLESLLAMYQAMRRADYNKTDIYCRLAAVYGCKWQCVYNALQRARKSRQLYLNVF